MNIRGALLSDTESLMGIFEEARGTIARLGIDQWQDGYPSESVILEDIRQSRSYVVEIGGDVCGTFVILTDGEKTYDKIYGGEWLTGNECGNYLALHRVAISASKRGSGISTAIIDFASAMARRLGRASLRIDTHSGNAVMRRMLEKHGFILCGVIHLESGVSRVAYEKLLN